MAYLAHAISDTDYPAVMPGPEKILLQRNHSESPTLSPDISEADSIPDGEIGCCFAVRNGIVLRKSWCIGISILSWELLDEHPKQAISDCWEYEDRETGAKSDYVLPALPTRYRVRHSEDTAKLNAHAWRELESVGA